MFAHMLADYVLQTNWLVVRKSQGWDGLALHGFMVLLMSWLVVPGYLDVLFVPILVYSLIHTVQDWVKVSTGPWVNEHKIPAAYPYMLDQVLHYIAIVGLQVLYAAKLQSPPSSMEVLVMAVGAVAISVTRFYDVTWWANWLDMIPYMNRWRTWGYAERLAMVALAGVGLFFLAPLCAIPRLWYAWHCGYPIWKAPRGALEVGIGILFSIILGLMLRGLWLAVA
jgi:hypothetical protein